MEARELIDRLGYAESEHYLAEDRGDFSKIVVLSQNSWVRT